MKRNIKRILGTVLAGVLSLTAVFAETIDLGDMEFDANDNGYFENAKAVDSSGQGKWKGIVIGFSSETFGNEKIVLPTDQDGFTAAQEISTKASVIFNNTTGATTEQVVNYIKKIKFENCKGIDQTVELILDQSVIDCITFTFADNEHFYQYIPYKSSDNFDKGDQSWFNAYKKAKARTFAGRTGYLATVTTIKEDMFIANASDGKLGWLGGTMLKHGDSDGELYYKTFTETTKTFSSSNKGKAGTDFNDGWYWACGPEKGQIFYKDLYLEDSGSNSTTEKQNKRNADDPDCGYFNWAYKGNQNEPNNYGSEPCLCTLLTGDGGYSTTGKMKNASLKKYSWNNIPWKNQDVRGYSAVGYIVEYGNLSTGDNGSGNGDIFIHLRCSLKAPREKVSVEVSSIEGDVTCNDPSIDLDEVPLNKEITIKANPKDDYYFDHWEDGNGTTLSTNESYTFTVTGPTTVKPVFKPLVTVSIPDNIQDGSITVTVNGVQMTGTSVKCKPGVTLIAQATANTGAQFSHFEDGDGNLLLRYSTYYSTTVPTNGIHIVPVFLVPHKHGSVSFNDLFETSTIVNNTWDNLYRGVLRVNLELTDNWTVINTREICLFGHKLSGKKIIVPSGVTLTITDCSANMGTVECDIEVQEGGTLNIEGGKYTGKIDYKAGTVNLAGKIDIKELIIANGLAINLSGVLDAESSVKFSAQDGLVVNSWSSYKPDGVKYNQIFKPVDENQNTLYRNSKLHFRAHKTEW